MAFWALLEFNVIWLHLDQQQNVNLMSLQYQMLY